MLAGEFTRVNNRNQQGLVRFTIKSKAPNDSGPKLFNATYPLNVTSTEAGTVRINWMANNDDDNENLTYRVYRDTQTAADLRHTLTKRIRRWESVTMGFTDTGLAPGSTHQYRVTVTDPFGNVANSPWTSVTVAASRRRQRLRQGRLRQPADQLLAARRSRRYDGVGRPGRLHAARPRRPGYPRRAGAIADDTDTASTFTDVHRLDGLRVQHSPPDVLSLETWFKTTA